MKTIMENPKTATERTGAGGRERSIILLLNGSERVIRIITFLNLCFMFILNHFTLLIGDDYTYCFSFASGRDRITSPIQILPSMAAHYGNMNGRLIVHGISQLMLMLPPGLFDVLNAGVFCLLCVIIYDYIWKLNHETHNALLYLAVVAALWRFVPSFGQVFLWLDGSCNYLWSIVLLLIYIKPLFIDQNPLSKRHLFTEQNSVFRRRLLMGLYICAGFIMGELIESASFAVMVFFLIWPLYTFAIRKKKEKLWMILPAFTMLPAYLFMILSPATVSGKIDEHINLRTGFLKACDKYLFSFRLLIIAGAIMIVFLAVFQIASVRMTEALIWGCLSFGMNCMYSVASYYPGRSMLGSAVFLIIATGLLMAGIFDNGFILLNKERPYLNRKAAVDNMKPDNRMTAANDLADCFTKQNKQNRQVRRSDYYSSLISLLAAVYVCAFVVYQASILMVIGTKDIYHSWEQMRSNETYIRREVSKGNLDVTIDTIQTSTYYSAAKGIMYVDTSSAEAWPNQDMAKYYGAAHIIGNNVSPSQ